jgi:ADP-ribose pyrophosphatase
MKRPADWAEVRREQVADCRIFQVERSIARSPVDGSEHDFYRVLSRDWVHIVPVTPDEKIVMVRQYRHGSAEVGLEVPGGIVDAGEEPAEAALRECLEETGYEARHIRSIGTSNPNPGIHSHQLHAFSAIEATKVSEIKNTPTEQTEVELVPIADIAALLRAGAIDHTLVIATLWRFLDEYR